MLLSSKGTIIYHSRWVILECPKDIMEYYWYWIYKQTGKKLNKPRFGSHVSIVRGQERENGVNEVMWNHFHEQEIDFHYSNVLETNGDYWWLPVTCQQLNELREGLGLESEPPFGFHLTIGREYNGS